jgi:hypothetical protein
MLHLAMPPRGIERVTMIKGYTKLNLQEDNVIIKYSMYVTRYITTYLNK